MKRGHFQPPEIGPGEVARRPSRAVLILASSLTPPQSAKMKFLARGSFHHQLFLWHVPGSLKHASFLRG